MSRATDEKWMRRCLELARKAAGSTSPNPMVGAVVVKNGKKIAEGIHWGPGKAHAEVMALKKAGARARGATLYVNLEPCNHQGKTPPCAPAVLKAGLARVVFGSRDPYKGHGGQKFLQKKGQVIQGGVLEHECDTLNRFFARWAADKRPYVVLKAALSRDGRMANEPGGSQWITGPAARKDGRKLRGELDAILTGVGTILADDPQLTTRERGRPDPIRIILDTTLRTPVTARVLPRNSKSKVRTIIATTARASRNAEAALVKRGAEIWKFSRTNEVPLDELARRMAKESILSVLVEAGPRLTSAFLRAGLVDELVLYVAPTIIGGEGLALDVDTLGSAQMIGPDKKFVIKA
jgi:diaminohydroxyphosphoribosylaminopyrimidine deaminase/5-amino-6-(5-phosphoribosylamino)uracil reductase